MTAVQVRAGERKILGRSLLGALFLEAALLTAVGWHAHWLAHPQKTHGLDDSQFIEAQLVELPPVEHLVEEKPSAAQPVVREAVLSKIPGKGRKAKPEEKALAESNLTHSAESTGPPLGPTHGPVAIFNPPPVLPESFRADNLSKSLVIEFFITAQGAVTPRLIRSSGNEELDAIAIETVKRWQFRPAEEAHHALDSKVRLRIVFDVH